MREPSVFLITKSEESMRNVKDVADVFGLTLSESSYAGARNNDVIIADTVGLRAKDLKGLKRFEKEGKTKVVFLPRNFSLAERGCLSGRYNQSSKKSAERTEEFSHFFSHALKHLEQERSELGSVQILDHDKFLLQQTPKTSFRTLMPEDGDDMEERSEDEAEESNLLIEKESEIKDVEVESFKSIEEPLEFTRKDEAQKSRDSLVLIQGLVTYSTEMENVLIVSKDYTNKNTQKIFENVSNRGRVNVVFVPEGLEVLDLASVTKTLTACTLHFGIKSSEVLPEVVPKLNRILEEAVRHKPKRENIRRKGYSTLMTTEVHEHLLSILISKVKASQQKTKTQKERWEGMFCESTDYLLVESAGAENIIENNNMTEINLRCDAKHLFLGMGEEEISIDGEKVLAVRSWVNELIPNKKSCEICRKHCNGEIKSRNGNRHSRKCHECEEKKKKKKKRETRMNYE